MGLRLEDRHPSPSSSAVSREGGEIRFSRRVATGERYLELLPTKALRGVLRDRELCILVLRPNPQFLLIECYPAVSAVQGTRKVQAQRLRAPLGRSLVQRRREVSAARALDPSSALDFRISSTTSRPNPIRDLPGDNITQRALMPSQGFRVSICTFRGAARCARGYWDREV